MAGIESNSPVLPPITSGKADSWSFDSASISNTEEVLAEATDPGDQLAPDDAELAADPAAPPPPKVEATSDSAAPQPPKKRQTITERTNVLKAELADTLRQRAQARAEYDDLVRQRDALRAEVTRPAPRTPEPVTPPVSKLGPAPDWDTYEADGKSWKQFQDDTRVHILAEAEQRAEVKVRAEIAAIDQRRQADVDRARSAEASRAYVAKLEAAQAKYPDFVAQVDANLAGITTSALMKSILVHHAQGAEVLYHWARHPHEAQIIATLQPTRPVLDAIRKAEDPIPLLSHFAAHRAEFEALTQMPPAEQLYELGRLHERLSTGARVASDPPGRSTPKSPAPPFRAMGGTAAAVGGDSESSSDDFADWVRAENRRQGVNGGGRRR